MPTFGAASLQQLVTCHPDLQQVMHEAIKLIDFQIIEGHRGEAAQNAAFAAGKSKLRFPNGNHNQFPSRAVDIAPFPVDWSDNPKALERFVFLQGVVYAVARSLNIAIRQGLDWDGDHDMRDERFRDYPHVELRTP